MTATVTMRDAIFAANVPITGTQIAAGYLNGLFDDWADLFPLFPSIPKVAIDVNGSAPGAQVRDWEDGDKGGSLENWVIEHNQLSGASDAVIYSNRQTIAEVRRLTGSQVLGKDYYLWVATLDGTIFGPDQLAGVIACQFTDVNDVYDESKVWPTAAVWWSDGIINDPHPAPLPPSPNLPANWTYGPVRPDSGSSILANVGPHSFSVLFDAPSTSVPAGLSLLPGITDYQVNVCVGTGPTGPNIDGYPRYIAKGGNPEVWQGGGLAPKTTYWFGVRAIFQGTHGSPWTGGSFTTPAA